MLVTRSGTSRYSGSLHNDFRNETLDAIDWFANRNRVLHQVLCRNNFGGVSGVPVEWTRLD